MLDGSVVRCVCRRLLHPRLPCQAHSYPGPPTPSSTSSEDLPAARTLLHPIHSICLHLQAGHALRTWESCCRIAHAPPPSTPLGFLVAASRPASAAPCTPRAPLLELIDGRIPVWRWPLPAEHHLLPRPHADAVAVALDARQ